MRYIQQQTLQHDYLEFSKLRAFYPFFKCFFLTIKPKIFRIENRIIYYLVYFWMKRLDILFEKTNFEI